ncbi:hypothetical protein R7P79_27425, partial [Vibrio sp. 2128(2023)]
MCTKHQGCQSGKIKTAVPLSAHDSCCAPTKPTLNIAQAGVDTVESSCCSGGSCSSDTADEEGPAEQRESSIR